MRLLIVDDEIYAIQGIMDSVDWDNLSFDEILTANSYTQALQQFEDKEIDILLSDIEMPFGTGLDLVAWVKENHPETECIFLTCHDEFDFAKQAISLKCLDYLMKPVDPDKLKAVLLQGIALIESRRRDEQYKKYAQTYMATQEGSGDSQDEKSQLDVIEEAERYIMEHLAETITVEGLAKLVYLSPDHLTRLFKKERGQTVIDYITSQRMFWAKELLSQMDMSIAMVSAKVGYPNYSYFTKVFKKHYGMTPREYRQGLGKGSC